MKKVKASMMNAIHDLPLLVARDEGFFRDQGLDVEIVKTPGSGQRDSDHQALRANVFDRTMEALYDQGACDQFRMCEWGVMKRAVESNVGTGHRPAKIVALGSAMSSFAIVTDAEVAHLRARAAQGPADRGQPLQRLAFHHAQAARGVPQARADQDHVRRHHEGAPRGGGQGRGRRGEPDGALDQHRREARAARADRIAFDAQRGRGRRARRTDAGEDVPRRGGRGRGDRAGTRSATRTTWSRRPAACSSSRTSSSSAS